MLSLDQQHDFSQLVLQSETRISRRVGFPAARQLGPVMNDRPGKRAHPCDLYDYSVLLAITRSTFRKRGQITYTIRFNTASLPLATHDTAMHIYVKANGTRRAINYPLLI